METITLFVLVSCFVGIVSSYEGGQETVADNYEDDSGKCYGTGPIKSDNICSLCFCRNNQKTCTRQSCNQGQGVPRGCKEVKVPGKCCPEIKCPDESGYDGQGPESEKYKEGKDESYCTGNGPIVSSNPCSLCFCRNNRKTCTRQSCRQAVPRGCSEVSVPGKCCPEIRCPDTTGQVDNYGEQTSQGDNYEETPRDDPSDNGRCFGDGEIPNPNPCNKCVCRNGRKSCPAWNCPQRPSGPNCRYVKVPDQCCPKEQCDRPIITSRPPTSECSSGDGPLIHPNPCNKCKCKSGTKYCMKIRCQQLLPRRGCVIQKLEGQCCAKYVCSRNPTTSVPDNYGQSDDIVNVSEISVCKKDGPVPSDDPCNQCSCRRGSMRCRKLSCPSVQPGCVASNNPGQCCPKIVCDNFEKYEKKY